MSIRSSIRSPFSYVLIALALAILLAGCSAGQQSTGDVYVGVSGPLTGNNAQYGAQWKKGFDLALDEVNGQGGVRGRKLRYVFEDSQSDPKQSVVVAQKLVADQRIVIELGDFSSPASMAASPIYQRAGLVQLGFTNSHPDFTKGGDFVWSNASNQKDEAPFLADYAVKDLGLKRLGVLHLNTDWGKTTTDLFVARAKEHGAEIVAQEAYLGDEKDFRSALTNVREARPDGIVLISYYTDGALIAQQMRALGINLPTVAAGSTYSPKFLELGGAAVNGIYVPTNFSADDPRPEVQTFVNAYRAKYGEEPDYFSAQAYDTLKLVAAVIEQSGPDRKAIKEGLARVKDVPSVIYGSITFDAERRVAKPVKVRLVVRDGKFVVWDRTRPPLAQS